MALAGDGQRVDDRGAVTGVTASDKEPVLLAQSAGTDGIFDEVVVDLDLAVVKVFAEGFPELEGVGAGFTEGGIRQGPPGTDTDRDMDPFEDAFLFGQPAPFPGLGIELFFTVAFFAGVEPGDQSEDQTGFSGIVVQGDIKLVPCMRPTADPGDIVAAPIPVVCPVAVGLQQAAIAIEQACQLAMTARQATVKD